MAVGAVLCLCVAHIGQGAVQGFFRKSTLSAAWSCCPWPRSCCCHWALCSLQVIYQCAHPVHGLYRDPAGVYLNILDDASSTRSPRCITVSKWCAIFPTKLRSAGEDSSLFLLMLDADNFKTHQRPLRPYGGRFSAGSALPKRCGAPRRATLLWAVVAGMSLSSSATQPPPRRFVPCVSKSTLPFSRQTPTRKKKKKSINQMVGEVRMEEYNGMGVRQSKNE